MKTERCNAIETGELIKARIERRARGCDPTSMQWAEPKGLGSQSKSDNHGAGLDAELGDEFVRLLAGGVAQGAVSTMFGASNKSNFNRREIGGTNPFFSPLNKQEEPNSAPSLDSKVSLTLDTELHGKLEVTAKFDGVKIHMTIAYPAVMSLVEKSFVSKVVSAKLGEIFNMSVEVSNG
jgi:hypothetical protein